MAEYEQREHIPEVTVRIPTREEMREVFLQVYPGVQMADERPEGFRLLRCGGKQLLFRLGYDQGATLVVNSLEHAAHISGETTALYREVKRLIEEHVRTHPVLYTYQLATKNPAMLAWARGKGNDLFHWDQEISGEGKGVSGSDNPTVFVKTFLPRAF